MFYKHFTMTTYLKYYAKENRRHADVEKVKGTFEMAVKMSKALFKHFHVAPITVKLLDKKKKEFKRRRKTKSWFSKWAGPKGTPQIVYHKDMLTPLTVAHEVAHYVDSERQKMAKVRRHRWHGVAHRNLTDQGVAVLKRHPEFRSYFEDPTKAKNEVVRDTVNVALQLANTGAPTIEMLSKKMVQDFFDSLPERLTCASCTATLPKMNFGVRVMKRDANGLPAKMRSQSYCKACR